MGSLTKGIIERRKPPEEYEERFDAVNSTSSEKGQPLSREVRLLCSGQGTLQYSRCVREIFALKEEL